MLKAGLGSGLMVLAAAILLGATDARAQRRSERDSNQTPGMYLVENGSSDSRRSNRRKSQPTANPPSTAAPPKTADNKGKPAAKPAARTVATGNATTSTIAKGKPGAPAPAAKPGAPKAAGGASGAGYGAQGQIREITKEMAESLRPMRVDYDPIEMEQKPCVIILNPRRYESSSAPSGNMTIRRRIESPADFVRPL